MKLLFQLWRAYETHHKMLSSPFTVSTIFARPSLVLKEEKTIWPHWDLSEALNYSQLSKHPLKNSRYLKMVHHSPQSPPPCILSNRGDSFLLYYHFPMLLYIRSVQMRSLVFDLLYFFILV